MNSKYVIPSPRVDQIVQLIPGDFSEIEAALYSGTTVELVGSTWTFKRWGSVTSVLQDDGWVFLDGRPVTPANFPTNGYQEVSASDVVYVVE